MATEITDFSGTAASNTFNWPENMAPSAVNNAGREDEAILAKWFKDISGSLSSGGSSNAYTLTLNRTKFEVTSAFDGFLVAFQANFSNTGAATLNVTPSGGAAKGAKAIVKNGNTALTSGDIVSGQAVLVVYDNSQDNFQMVSAPSASTGLSNVVEDTSPQLGGALDTNSFQVNWSKGIDVASATALTLGTDGNTFDITGTTAIETIGTLGIGTVVKLHFDAALTLTHNATDLVLPGGANITTAAGDEAEFVEYAAGDWRCTNYTKATGGPVVGAILTAGTTLTVDPVATPSSNVQAHGLSSRPFIFDGYLECKTTDAGYAVGDKIDLAYLYNDTAVAITAGAVLLSDATNVTLLMGASQFRTINKSTQADAPLIDANWKAIVVPYALS